MTPGEFKKLLEESDYFADIMNTHRHATADIIAAILAELIAQGKLAPTEVLAVLSRLNADTDRPSLDSSRRYLVARIRDALKGGQ